MKRTSLVIALAAALAACGFGDNGGGGAALADTCGDGLRDPGESCDDGNELDGDGCSVDCAVEVPDPVCGNSTREVGEACDDGNSAGGDGCSPTCDVESPAACGLVPQSGRPANQACDLAFDGAGRTECRALRWAMEQLEPSTLRMSFVDGLSIDESAVARRRRARSRARRGYPKRQKAGEPALHACNL